MIQNYILEEACLQLTYCYVEYETSISSWHIWNDDRTKIIAFPLLQLATRLNSQNPYETEIHNEIWHINLYMNTGISKWHFWRIDPRKCGFSFYFYLLDDYWPPNTRNSLVYNSWNEMEQYENRAFQLLKIRKMNISWTLKSSTFLTFSSVLGLRVWKF